jgi:PAS domain S-box-containing protein
MVIDADGKMLAWNSTAEKLYGRDWHQMRQENVEEIYENPQAYQDFLKEVKQKYSVREKVFKIIHPQKGRRFISTSTTVLYDGHHNFQGVLTLGRDVTRVKKMEKKYKRSATWLISMFIFLGIITAAGLIAYPYFSKGYQSKDVRQMQLRDVLAKDYVLLMSLLEKIDEPVHRSEIRQVMQNFFSIQKSTGLPYTGLILLDRDKNVIEAYSLNPNIRGSAKAGSSYASIKFQGRQDSLHKVLTLYRSHKDHPMGKKGIELAFEWRRDGRLIGWLLFQMDTDHLQTDSGLDVEQLEDLQFE